MAKRQKAIEARFYSMIACIGDDGAVIGVGFDAPGAQGDMAPLDLATAESMRAYLDRYISRKKPEASLTPC